MTTASCFPSLIDLLVKQERLKKKNAPKPKVKSATGETFLTNLLSA